MLALLFMISFTSNYKLLLQTENICLIRCKFVSSIPVLLVKYSHLYVGGGEGSPEAFTVSDIFLGLG